MDLAMRMLTIVAALCWTAAVIADDKPLVGGHPKEGEAKTAAQPDEQDDANAQDKLRPRAPEKKKVADGKRDEKGKGKQVKKKSPDAEREEAAIVFVREHQPELLELLKRLKGTKEKDYQQAIRELSRDSQRIEALKEKDPKRFEQEVRAWQLDSRIRLLTAKLSLEDRPELQEDLKAALAERADLRLEQRKLDRERVAARLTKLDEEIAALVKNREDDLKKTFDRLVRAAERARPKTKPEAKKEK